MYVHRMTKFVLYVRQHETWDNVQVSKEQHILLHTRYGLQFVKPVHKEWEWKMTHGLAMFLSKVAERNWAEHKLFLRRAAIESILWWTTHRPTTCCWNYRQTRVHSPCESVCKLDYEKNVPWWFNGKLQRTHPSVRQKGDGVAFLVWRQVQSLLCTRRPKKGLALEGCLRCMCLKRDMWHCSR